jgi:glycerol-3-phosphate cytidylyltransferase
MKVGITFSAFDLLHAGHIKMLEDAKRQCDYLIVGLQTDPTIDRPEKNKPTQTVVERYIQLKGCKFVDEIVPYATEQDLEDILRSFKIDVRIVGDEYKSETSPEEITVKKKELNCTSMHAITAFQAVR